MRPIESRQVVFVSAMQVVAISIVPTTIVIIALTSFDLSYDVVAGYFAAEI